MFPHPIRTTDSSDALKKSHDRRRGLKAHRAALWRGSIGRDPCSTSASSAGPAIAAAVVLAGVRPVALMSAAPSPELVADLELRAVCTTAPPIAAALMSAAPRPELAAARARPRELDQGAAP